MIWSISFLTYVTVLGRVWRAFDLAERPLRWADPKCRLTEDPNAAEVVKIEMGQLYLVRPGNIRSSRECMCDLFCFIILQSFISLQIQ